MVAHRKGRRSRMARGFPPRPRLSLVCRRCRGSAAARLRHWAGAGRSGFWLREVDREWTFESDRIAGDRWRG